MTKHEHEQAHFEQKLQQAYLQNKAEHPMPAKMKQQILQHRERSKHLAYHRWFRHAQLALGSIFLAVLGYLMLQPVSISSYQIVVAYTDTATALEEHSLTVRSIPAVVAQFTADASQQRYQQMLLAQNNISQFHAEQGVLQKMQQNWQITLCNQQVVSIDEALLQQLITQGVHLTQWQVAQNIDVFRGPQGQILAIRPTAMVQQCPVS